MSRQYFFFRSNGMLERMDIEAIIALEAHDNYVKFIAETYSSMVRVSLESALAQLPGDMFVQITRSLAVSLDRIRIVGKDFVMLGPDLDTQVPVSKKYYPELIKKIKIIDESPASTSKTR